jgi:hypothetical protein
MIMIMIMIIIIIIIIMIIIIIITRIELDFHLNVVYIGNDNLNNYSDIYQFYLTLLYQLQILLCTV